MDSRLSFCRGMKCVTSFFRRHGLPLIVAFVIGVLTIAPSFYFRYFSGQFQGLDLFRSDGELNQLAAIREAYDGHVISGNVYTVDGKTDRTFAQQPLPGFILASTAHFLHLSPETLNLFTKFFLPFFLALLLFAFFQTLFAHRLFSAIGTWLVFLIPASTSFFLDPSTWARIFLHWDFGGIKYQFLYFARSINPQFSSFFVFGFFLLLWKLLFDTHPLRRRWVLRVTSGLLIGLSFYTYFYAYSFLAVFGVVTFFIFFARKKWAQVIDLLWVGGIGILIATPFLWNLYQVLQSPAYLAVRGRVGLFVSHQFIFSRVWWGALLIWFLFYRKFSEAWRWFVFVFLLTGFIVTNQQLVTGQVIPQFSHYHWYYLAPVITVLFVIALFRLLPARWVFWATLAFSLVGLWIGIGYQVKSYQAQVSSVLAVQRYVPVLNWLNTYAPKDSTIFANLSFSTLAVAYTSHNVYIHDNLTDTLVSLDRLRDVLFVEWFLDGVRPEDAPTVFQERRDTLGAFLYGQYYRQAYGCYGCFSDAILQDFVQAYQAFVKQDFVTQLKRYPVDYVVWDKKVDPTWQADRWFQRPLFDTKDFLIYAIR